MYARHVYIMDTVESDIKNKEKRCIRDADLAVKNAHQKLHWNITLNNNRMRRCILYNALNMH
jgi:hypothetical protein